MLIFSSMFFNKISEIDMFVWVLEKQTVTFKFFTMEHEVERQIYNILFVWIWYVNIGKCLFYGIAATNMSLSKYKFAGKLS